MRGPKPTPRALKVLRGNPSKTPFNDAEPMPSPAALDPPAQLGKAAQAEWRRLAPMLARLGVLTESDTDALAAYCEAFVTWRTSTRHLRRHGLVRATKYGLSISPHVKIANAAQAQMRVLLVEFGMTPSARSRIHATPAPPVSKWGTAL